MQHVIPNYILQHILLPTIVDFELIRAIDDSVYTGAVDRKLRTPVSWKLTVGVGKASWFGQGLPTITRLNLCFLNLVENRVVVSLRSIISTKFCVQLLCYLLLPIQVLFYNRIMPVPMPQD